MYTQKLAATFTMLMIALGIAGFAYAHWQKIVTIDGKVTTGTLHVTPSFYMEIKQDEPVASYRYEVDPERNYVEVWIDNVYPFLYAEGYIDLKNDGSVPVNLVGCEITAPGLIAVWNETMEYWEIYDITASDPLLIATGSYQFDFPDGYPQIDPGNTAYIHFWIHFEEGLPQDTSYKFTITFTFWNWNEVP